MQIIKDKTKLSAHITSTIKTYRSVGERVHVAVVSALYHAAVHGDATHLNRVYAGLRSNDQQAVKMYIRRVSAIVGLDGASPDGLANEVVIAAVENGSILALKKEEFTVTKGHTSAPAKFLAELCEARFIKPDGETDKHVLDRNNFAEVKVLGDSQALDQLLRVVKSIESETDTKKVQVSDQLARFFQTVRDKAEHFKAGLADA